MARLIDEITGALKAAGFECSIQMRHGLEVVCTVTLDGHHDRIILPLEIEACSPEQAARHAEDTLESIRMINSYDGEYPLIITRDRWERQREMMQKRLLAHLELFFPIYARNCEVRKIDKAAAREFLERNHSYGYAACRYCYGLFFKRHTGHIAQMTERGSADKNNKDISIIQDGIPESCDDTPGTLMAVATFSNARKWIKEDRIIRSYEWTRYASLPEVRLSGGMGRLMKAFIKDVCPDDLMSYADLEWSKGDVYRRLGFELEGTKEPVMFAIDSTWRRFPVKTGMTEEDLEMTREEGQRFFRNFGSNKYRLKLTDYE
jgi:hypothetical protein